MAETLDDLRFKADNSDDVVAMPGPVIRGSTAEYEMWLASTQAYQYMLIPACLVCRIVLLAVVIGGSSRACFRCYIYTLRILFTRESSS